VPKPLIVGLTGAVGAGKSTLAAELARLGAVVIDADEIGHDLLASPSRVTAALARAFGTGVLTASGAADRAKLAAVAFRNAENAALLNKITHPPLLARVRAEIARQPDADIIVIDAALIVEWRKRLHVDVVVVVDAARDLRRRRVRLKYGRSFNRRELSQLGVKAKLAGADIVISNSFSKRKLVQSAKLLYNILLTRSRGGKLPPRPLRIG